MKSVKISVILFLLAGSMACSKVTVTNNPDIDDRTVSISLDSSGNANNELIDLDDDGTDDFNIFSVLPSLNKNNSDVGINGLTFYEFSTEAQSPVSNNIKSFAEGASVNSASGTWSTLASFYFNLNGIAGYPVGINEQGDKFIGFRVNDGGDFYYGWMKVNVTGGHKLTIKEYAVQKIADTAILAGEK
ncbi:MAG: hypothetical protein IPM95_10615 [Sphingobacteriales bacterium]|nr:hypothetical protein [Sphingobacteriales bacterium]